MVKKLFLLLILLSGILLSGCSDSYNFEENNIDSGTGYGGGEVETKNGSVSSNMKIKEKVCNGDEISFGKSCCLDLNYNSVCDSIENNLIKKDNGLKILDLIITPMSGVYPGSNAKFNLRLKNEYNHSKHKIKAIIISNKLGINKEIEINNLNSGEIITSKDILINFPEDSKIGKYEFNVVLINGDNIYYSSKNFEIEVLREKEVTPKMNLLISYPKLIELNLNETSTFKFEIINSQNSISGKIQVEFSGNEFNQLWLDNNNLYLNPGDSKVIRYSLKAENYPPNSKKSSFIVINIKDFNNEIIGSEIINIKVN